MCGEKVEEGKGFPQRQNYGYIKREGPCLMQKTIYSRYNHKTELERVYNLTINHQYGCNIVRQSLYFWLFLAKGPFHTAQMSFLYRLFGLTLVSGEGLRIEQ